MLRGPPFLECSAATSKRKCNKLDDCQWSKKQCVAKEEEPRDPDAGDEEKQCNGELCDAASTKDDCTGDCCWNDEANQCFNPKTRKWHNIS